MQTVRRLILAERLSRLYNYGFGQSPDSAICVFGQQIAEWLETNENQTEVTPVIFVRAYMLALEAFFKESVGLCVEDYGNLPAARSELTVQMWNIAERLVSKQFSEESFAMFQTIYLRILLALEQSPSKAIN